MVRHAADGVAHVLGVELELLVHLVHDALRLREGVIGPLPFGVRLLLDEDRRAAERESGSRKKGCKSFHGKSPRWQTLPETW